MYRTCTRCYQRDFFDRETLLCYDNIYYIIYTKLFIQSIYYTICSSIHCVCRNNKTDISMAILFVLFVQRERESVFHFCDDSSFPSRHCVRIVYAWLTYYYYYCVDTIIIKLLLSVDLRLFLLYSLMVLYSSKELLALWCKDTIVTNISDYGWSVLGITGVCPGCVRVFCFFVL